MFEPIVLRLSAREQASVTIDEIYQELNDKEVFMPSELNHDINDRLKCVIDENEESPDIKQGYHFDLKMSIDYKMNLEDFVNLEDFPDASLLQPVDGLTALDDLHPQDHVSLRVFALTDLRSR